MKSPDWSVEEVDVLIRAYFEMFGDASSGKDVVKKQRIDELRSRLPRRSHGAIEYKFGNVSAVLSDLGLDRMPGYVPFPRYQQLLKDRVEVFLKLSPGVAVVSEYVPAVMETPESQALKCTEAPDLFYENASGQVGEGSRREYGKPDGGRERRPVLGVDYEALSRKKNAVGEAGERHVLNYERHRLVGAGRPDLAERVEWVSKTRGDGAGYDVLSWMLSDNGKESEFYIEVKTTSGGQREPFMITANELDFLNAHPECSAIYRVYSLWSSPSLYVLKPPIKRDACEPVLYAVRVC